jgi:hypothetical protein
MIKAIFIIILISCTHSVYGDEIVFSQKNADGTLLRVIYSEPTSPTTTQPEGFEKTDLVKFRRYQIVSADGKSIKTLMSFEEPWSDPRKTLGYAKQPPFKFLAVRAGKDGIYEVITAHGWVYGMIYSTGKNKWEHEPIFIQDNERNEKNYTNFQAGITGDPSSGDLQVAVTTPDGSKKLFKFVADGKQYRWRVADLGRATTNPSTEPIP